MRSVRRVGDWPAGTPLLADDLLEFHAARILLLLRLCGRDERIDGLTKLAKLDFFVRYPSSFARACSDLGKTTTIEGGAVESRMVRHHYGPWDKRYYQVLAFLEASGLLKVAKEKRHYVFRLTTDGNSRATTLETHQSFERLVKQMREVKRVMGGKTGTALKDLIYRLFRKEVAERNLGEAIQP